MSHAHNPPRCVPGDFLDIGADTPPETLAALEEYFRIFAQPVRSADGKHVVCVGCGKPVDGLMSAITGSHVAHAWGLTHGEARCSGCGYPSRGMHYVKGHDGSEILTVRNFFLYHHPDELVTEE